MKKAVLSVAALLFMLSGAFAQLTFEGEEAIKAQFKKDITTLADDAMQGREAGTPGEEMAAEYIANRFTELGIKPLEGQDNYYQEFEFQAAVERGSANTLMFGGTDYKVERDFYPLAYSTSGKVAGDLVDLNYGIEAPDMSYNDYEDLKNLEGKVGLINIGTPDGDNPHSKYGAYTELSSRIGAAKRNGLAAVLLYNPTENFPDPSASLSRRVTSLEMPIIFLKKEAAGRAKKAKSKPVTLAVELNKVKRTAKNVLAYLDNGAAHTVVIGAHYDHLGMGDEGSLHRGEPAIHNGADDNASGIALMFALAEKLKEGKVGKENNYLFMGFSGEEKGLLGSNYFCKNPLVDLEQVNYMLNMDMVGRLDEAENIIGINGVGTSPRWTPVLKKIKIGKMDIKTTESGIGASDHTSFYLKDIPAIHFFSGTHSDYHKPSDDSELINYEGMWRIYQYMLTLIDRMDEEGKLEFSKTKNEDSRDAPRFTVTLGVIPDYLYDGKGMRIDGVTDGKTASKAGLKAGDVVVKMGDYDVNDMMSYMKALSKFKKGDQTMVVVEREKKEVKKKVRF